MADVRDYRYGPVANKQDEEFYAQQAKDYLAWKVTIIEPESEDGHWDLYTIDEDHDLGISAADRRREDFDNAGTEW